MTWRGCDPAIEITLIDDLRSYIRSLNYASWRPSNFVIHNTASPTLYQWWHSVPPAQRMENLRAYYENDMGWSAGPHCFIDGKSWWIFTPFNVKGVHSPSWNGTMLGFECVGDYSTESDESGMGAEVMKMAHALSGEVCDFFGWSPDNLKFHKEDPQTTHDCPGANMVKSEFIDDVQQYMGEGGDDQQPPIRRHRGVVAGLVAGDTLNIRATASSSAPIIGTADNGDELVVAGEAWNGSTHWLRIQFGRALGSDVAVFGWVSAQYVAQEAAPTEPTTLQKDITATVYGGAADDEHSAYPPYDSNGQGEYLNDTDLYVAVPWAVDDPAERERGIRVYNRATGKSAAGPIKDKGPWMVTDNYPETGTRPLAETCFHEATPLPSGPNEGRVPLNPAGIDISPALAREIEIDGLGLVDWEWEPVTS